MENPPSRPTLSIELSDAGDGYIMAECLDIPGCISQGKTHQEALANLMDAISVCLEVIAQDAAAGPMHHVAGIPRRTGGAFREHIAENGASHPVE